METGGEDRSSKRNMISNDGGVQKKWGEVWIIDFQKKKHNEILLKPSCAVTTACWVATDNLKFIYHLHLSCQLISVLYCISSTTSLLSVSLDLSKRCLICYIMWIWNICFYFFSSSWQQRKMQSTQHRRSHHTLRVGHQVLTGHQKYHYEKSS